MRRSGVRIGLGSLVRGDHHFDFFPEPEVVELDDRFSEISVHVHLMITGDSVVAQIDASAIVSLICDRTLADFDLRIEGSSTVLCTDTPSDSDEGFDEVVAISPADQSIDLSGIVRDTLLLAVPSRAIAPGAEGADIRTIFSDDDSQEMTDPRWDDLKKIKNADDSSV